MLFPRLESHLVKEDVLVRVVPIACSRSLWRKVGAFSATLAHDDIQCGQNYAISWSSFHLDIQAQGFNTEGFLSTP